MRAISSEYAALSIGQFESNPPVTYNHEGQEGHGAKIYSVLIPAVVVGAVLLATTLFSCCCRGSLRTLSLTRGPGDVSAICPEERPVLWDVLLRHEPHSSGVWEDMLPAAVGFGSRSETVFNKCSAAHSLSSAPSKPNSSLCVAVCARGISDQTLPEKNLGESDVLQVSVMIAMPSVHGETGGNRIMYEIGNKEIRIEKWCGKLGTCILKR